MKKYYKLTIIALMTLCFLLSVTVSASPGQPTDKPKVVRKKIHAPGQKAPGLNSHSGADDANVKSMPSPRSDLVQVSNNEESNGEADKILVAENTSTNPEAPAYDPTGRTDPFEPLFKNISQKEENITFTPKLPPKGHIPGDLEKIDISQLKLTGIVISANRNLGLVQEASGKGYIIHKGSYIGTRGGRVSEILKNKVVIKETMENLLGTVVVQKKELKLNNKKN